MLNKETNFNELGFGVDIEHSEYLSNFNIVSRIGTGSFGSVFLVVETLSQKQFALKISEFFPEDIKNFLLNESLILSLINCKYFPKLYNCEIKNERLLMTLEYCSGRNLLGFLSDNGIIPEKTVLLICKQIVEALDYLHSNNIAHRDLKLENIIITDEFEIKICDFGFSTFYNRSETIKDYCGTIYYCSPEVYGRTPYNGELNDIWSIGVCLLILLIGEEKFSVISDKLEYSGFLNGIEFFQEIYRSKFLNQDVKLLVKILKSIFTTERKGRITLNGLKCLLKLNCQASLTTFPSLLDPFTINSLIDLGYSVKNIVRRISNYNTSEHHIFNLIYMKTYDELSKNKLHVVQDFELCSKIISKFLITRNKLFCCYGEQFIFLNFTKKVLIEDLLKPSGFNYVILKRTILRARIQLEDIDLVVEFKFRGRYLIKVIHISGDYSEYIKFLIIVIRSHCLNDYNSGILCS